MKNKIVSLITGLTLVSVLAAVPSALASNADVAKALVGSTAMDLPAKAANLVAKASMVDKESVAVAVVKAAIKLNPSSATEVVSAVVRENSTLAPVVAVTAATLQQKQMALITKAAAAAAPSQASKIVSAMIKQFPKQYSAVAIAASEGAPNASREILAAVAKSVPGVADLIQSAMASNGDVSVQSLMTQATASGFAAATVPQTTQPTLPVTPQFSPPIVSGGFQNFTGTPASFGPGSGYTDVPPGDRGYAGP